MARRAPVVWRELLLATTCLVAVCPVGYAASTVLPSGFSVAAGSGSVSTSNATTTIHQTTDKAVFNWQSFSISSGAGVVFQQPGSGSIALNRVTGGSTSQIDGKLTANGQVWIVNPNGVVFGAGSQVNVGGLLATTADIHNQDFLAGNYSFSGASGAAIVNKGTLRAASGGSVVLAGAQVRNDGLIQADLGTVQLAAGKSFALDLTGDKLIRFQVTAAVDVTPLGADGKPVDSLITNTGTLSAAGGRVLLTARAAKNIVDNVINTTGIIEATTASMVNGEIVLDGGDAGIVQVAGRLDASGKGAGETGGIASVLGDKVALAGRAAVDVSGDVGGGTALIGGAAHGAGPQRNATTTLVAGGATINADARRRGKGGSVVVWSDNYTRVVGSVSARGGALGGDGGFVETSSKGALGIDPSARIAVDAPNGKGGNWLLDPFDVVIGSAGPTTNGTFQGGIFTPFQDENDAPNGPPEPGAATIAASTIAQSLNQGTNVTITTQSTEEQAGNITVNSAIAKTAGSDATLTLNAVNAITIAAPITSTNNKLSVNLVAGGAVNVNAQVATNGGDFTSNSAQFSANSASQIAVGAGTLSLLADRIALGGGANSISGLGQAILAPVSDTTVVNLGSGTVGFALSQAELNTLAGFSNIDIGKQDGGVVGNRGTTSVTLGGALSFEAPQTNIHAGAGGTITMATDSAITLQNGGALNFSTGAGGSFTQQGGTLSAGASQVSIGADSIALNGATGSLTGVGSIGLSGSSSSTTIGVGTGAGTLTIGQTTLDKLAGFAVVGIGDGGNNNGSGTTATTTIDGAVAVRTTTGFGGHGNGASLVLGPSAAVTTTAPDGSGLAFFSGTGGSVTQSAGATVNADNSTLLIGADHLVLNGPVGSIQGARGVILAGGGKDSANAVTVGGAGSLVRQEIINKLAQFSHLTIGASLPAIPGVTPPIGTSLITVDGALTADIATTFAATAAGGTTVLNNGTALSSAGKALDFVGAVTLGGNGPSATLATIDTTNGGTTPAGASITFNGTVDGTVGRRQSLTLTAGGTGDITFGARVGVNDIGSGNTGDPNGVRLGDVFIKSADNVSLAMAPGTNGDGFSANSFTVGTNVGGNLAAGAASLNASSYINVNGSSSGPLASNGGSISIDTTGDITIAGNLRANGRFNNSASAGNGGTVQLVSGGNVTVNTTDKPAQTGFDTSTFSISANGVDANGAGSPGNGGAVSISAANINLPLGVFARGGDALIAGPNGGNGGSIALAANGNIAIGSASSGTVAGASTRGGASISGSGGAGGTITVAANTMELTQTSSRGGDTQASSGGGNAGNITLTATASSGDAVTLYGVADANTNATLVARGGRTGATFTSTGTTGGTLDGIGGNITIQGGPGGAALNGASDVRLATNTGTALGGGSLISLANSGGTAAGAITVAGPIAASTDNVESLRLAAQSGSVIVSGRLGSNGQRLSSLILGGNSSTMSFQSPVTLGTALLDQRSSGSVTFGGLLTVPDLIMSAGTVSLALNGGTAITGSATLSGTVTAPGIALTVPITLAGNTAIDTSAQNGPLALGTIDGAHALTLNAGGGAMTLGTVGGVMALSSLTASGGSISLASVSTTGAQSYNGATTLDGSYAAGQFGIGGATTLGGTTSVTSASAIDFGGAVDGAQALTLTGGGSVTLGPVGSVTPLSSMTASGGSISLASVSTTGAQSYSGPTTLGPDTALTTAGGAVVFNSNVTLGASEGAETLVTIDTTSGTAVAAGAEIHFAGTVGAGDFKRNDLRLLAGTAGDVVFDQQVGNLGNVTIAGARDVQMNAADGGAPAFGARSLAITAAGNVSAVGSINTDGQADSRGGLQDAGAISITAGGDVSLGSAANGFFGFDGVTAQGGSSTTPGTVAGNGAAISITASTIELPGSVSTRGGDANQGSTSGGDGGSLTLHASGAISVGNPAQFISSGGGNAASGSGGAGGSISIAGSGISLAPGIDARGGSDLSSASGSGGRGGSVTLSASAGDVTFLNPTNNFLLSIGGSGIVGGSGGAINVNATGAITLPDFVESAGSFAAGAGTGGAAGAITLNAATGGVTGNSLFAFGGESLSGPGGSGGAVTITSGGAVSFNGLIATGAGLGTPSSAVSGAVDIRGTSIGLGAGITLPGSFLPDLTGANGGGAPITLTATDLAAGGVTAGPLLASSVHVSAIKQVSLSDVTAIAGDIFLNGGSVTLNGPLSTASGNIFVTSSGPIQVNAPVTATGGDVTFADLEGTAIATTNAAIRAQNTAADVSADGTVSITGAVALTGSSATAGTGRTVSLRGPNGDIVITGSDIHAGDVTLSAGTGADVIFNANSQLVGNAGNGQAGNLSIVNARDVTMNAGSAIQLDGGLTIGTAAQPITGNVLLQAIRLDNNGDGNGAGGTVGMAAGNIGGTLTLNGPITTASGNVSGVSLAASGGVTINSAITLASGAVTVSSPLSLAGQITTSGGAIELGAVTLSADSSLNTAGGETAGGALTTGTIDGPHTLTINPGAGTVAVNGAIGGSTKLDGLVLNGSGTATIASVSALGLLDLSGKSAGSVIFPGAVNIDALTTAANPYSIAFNGGGTIGDPVFSNTGTLAFIGLMNVPAGLLSDGPSSTMLNGSLVASDKAIDIQHLVVAGDSDITTGAAPVILGSVDQGTHSLVINGVPFGSVTPPPPQPPSLTIPQTVQPATPSPPPPQVVDIGPPPPAPPPVDTVLGGQAEAAAALANIAPAAGAGSDETDTGSSTTTDGDKLTDILSKPLSNTPAPQPTGKKPSTTTVVISGLLSKFQPPSAATPPSGTTPSSQDFSNSGNEGRW